MKGLFYSKESRGWFLLIEEEVNCTTCQKRIFGEELTTMTHFFHKNSLNSYIYCSDCKNTKTKDIITNTGIVQNVYTVSNILNLPIDAEYVRIDYLIEQRTGSNRPTVFSVAMSDDGIKSDTETCKITNKTKHTGSFKGLKIGRNVKELDDIKLIGNK